MGLSGLVEKSRRIKTPKKGCLYLCSPYVTKLEHLPIR